MKLSEILTTIKDKFKSTDKIVHLVCGFALSLIFGLIIAPLVGLVVAVVAGAIKEFIDSKGYGTVDMWDFAFTVLGGIVAVPVAYLIH